MPMTMKMVPVALRTQSSNCFSLLKALAVDFEANARISANKKTGRPVPSPYRAGSATPERYFTARGMRLPKNRAAEIGQGKQYAEQGAPPDSACFDTFLQFVTHAETGQLEAYQLEQNHANHY